MSKTQFISVVLGAAVLLMLGVALTAVPGSARATSAGYAPAKGSLVHQLYAPYKGFGFEIGVSVPLTTPTPHVTPSLTAGPTFTPSGPPDLVGQMNWIGACPNPVLRISTRNLYPFSPVVVTSTTVLTNSVGDRIDITVPPNFGTEYAVYKDLGTCPDCIPFEWLCHLPFTEIVDYNNDVTEADETNNTASMGTLPPACDPCGPLPTATPTFTVTRTPSVTSTPTSTPTVGELPDLTGNVYWAAVCPAPVLRMFTLLNGPAASYAPTSTMRLTNNISETLDFPVPELHGPAASYQYDCSVGPCMPSSWLTHFPYTLTVDYNNVVVESNEGNNTAVEPYPPPVPTPCNMTPTHTPTSTRTPIPTATSCPIQFSDVPPGSTYYDYVRCLACRGIVSGYPDGTFRPNNLVTRGQTVKVVTLAAGLVHPIPPDQQSFQDVPPGSTFWLYIERTHYYNILGGYPCGSSSVEPCVPPNNLPYFRPNNPTTRGQMAKIMSNTAGFLEPALGQDFEDAPPGTTFYDFVQRLVVRGVISGYPCGGPGEPCVPPNNLPYFRPNGSSTRGQLVKTATRTFLPNCSTPDRR